MESAEDRVNGARVAGIVLKNEETLLDTLECINRLGMEFMEKFRIFLQVEFDGFFFDADFAVRFFRGRCVGVVSGSRPGRFPSRWVRGKLFTHLPSGNSFAEPSMPFVEVCDGFLGKSHRAFERFVQPLTALGDALHQ